MRYRGGAELRSEGIHGRESARAPDLRQPLADAPFYIGLIAVMAMLMLNGGLNLKFLVLVVA